MEFPSTERVGSLTTPYTSGRLWTANASLGWDSTSMRALTITSASKKPPLNFPLRFPAERFLTSLRSGQEATETRIPKPT